MKNVLMTESSPELLNLCAKVFPMHDLKLTTAPRNGVEAYRSILAARPDAAVLDVFMPGMDAFSLKEKLGAECPSLNVRFYAMGTFQNEELEREVMESGFSFYFLKPFLVDNLVARLRRDLNMGRQIDGPAGPQNLSTQDMVTDMLRLIGVPAHIKGYQFLREAILRVTEDPSLINAVSRSLYPEIALQYQTTASRVERAIRHAIEVAWDRGDMEKLAYFFGPTASSPRGKPTNSEFIAMLADRTILAEKRTV